MIYEAIKEIDWLTVDRFEGELVSCPINFSTVLERIKKYYEYHLQEDVTIFYIYGSNNLNFSYAFKNNQNYHAICIRRYGFEFKKIQNDLLKHKNIYFIDNKNEFSQYSSTKMRQNIIEEHIWGQYLIRCDDTLEEFSEGLEKIFTKNSG